LVEKRRLGSVVAAFGLMNADFRVEDFRLEGLRVEEQRFSPASEQ